MKSNKQSHEPTHTNKSQWRSSLFWFKQFRDMMLLALLLCGVATFLQRDMHSGQAFAIHDTDTHGNLIDLFSDNHPAYPETTEATLVYFWGSWCSVCTITSPMVNTLEQQGYNVITIAVASGSDKQINQYLQQHQYQFKVINQDKLNSGTPMSQQWGAHALPAIFIIDTHNQIRFVTSGVTTTWGMKLRLWLVEMFD